MFTFSLGVAIGFLILPARRAYYNYDWFRNYRKYTVKQSLAETFKDIWS